MFHPDQKYQTKWFAEAATQPLVEPSVSTWLVLHTIHTLFPDIVDDNYQRAKTSFPSFPENKRLKYNRSDPIFVGAVDQDEGSIDGTYGVHQEIFRELAGFNERQDNRFSKRLHLVIGDQKTTSFIRNIQASQREASYPYDRKEWLLPVPALFHIEMNLLHTITRTHWPASSTDMYATQATLEADRQYLNRTTQLYQKSPKHHILEPFVLQMHNARVLALFLQELRVQHPSIVREALKGYSSQRGTDQLNPSLETDLSRPLAAIFKKFEPRQLQAVAEGVASKYLGSSAWMGQAPTYSGQPDYMDDDLHASDFDSLFAACNSAHVQQHAGPRPPPTSEPPD